MSCLDVEFINSLVMAIHMYASIMISLKGGREHAKCLIWLKFENDRL